VTLFLIIFLPILAAIAIAAGAPARRTALVSALSVLGLTAFLALTFVSGKSGYQATASLPVLSQPAINLAVGIDGLSLVMLILSALVFTAAVWASPDKVENGSIKLYTICVQLIAAGCLGAFAATDMFFLYAFHELALIPTFLMIGLFGTGNRRAAAWKITVYLGVGSLILLAGLIALFHFSGSTSFDITTMKEAIAAKALSVTTQKWLYLSLLIGFGILVSLFPFHSWAPEAYASAPVPVTMLHAGVLKKFGLYGLLRLAQPMLPLGANHEMVLNILLFLLLGNILIVGFVTLAQKNLDQMLGYSSVMHMGYIFLGIASQNPIGQSGAVLLMLGHGLSIALLYMMSGEVSRQTGTMHMDQLGGLAQSTPRLGFLFGLAAFASIGLPGLANFAGEILVFFGAFKNTAAGGTLWFTTATILALWGVVISSVYMLRAFRKVFKGEVTSPDLKVVDLNWSQIWPAGLLAAALVIVGFFPNTVLHLVQPLLTLSR
jgi:NADH-quinone oxidoreductase subunit M